MSNRTLVTAPAPAAAAPLNPRDLIAPKTAERARTALHAGGMLRLPEVLALVGVSSSTWWAGIRQGRYPAGVRVSARCTAWRAADIAALLASFQPEAEA